MNRFKTLLPRIGLLVAGVAVGLLARQIFGPPKERYRPKPTIDRPIGDGVKLAPEHSAYIPIDLPIDKLPEPDLPVESLKR